MKKITLILVLICVVTSLWATDVFVANQDERILPPDSAWVQIYDSLQVDAQQWAQQEYERLSAQYVLNGHYDYALFLTNEYGFWIRAKRRQREAIALADSMITVCEPHLSKAHVELMYAYYNQAVSYGSNPLAYPWYLKFFANCPEDMLKSQMFQARLYFGASKLWKGLYTEAWDSWERCLNSDLNARQKVVLYSMIGVAVRATDLEVSYALLGQAWQVINDSKLDDLVNSYKTINFLTIFTFLNEEYDKALDYALQGMDFLAGDGRSLFSYMTIPSDMHCIAAESCFYLDQFQRGDSILRYLDEHQNDFKDAALIPAKIAQYRGMMYNERELFDSARQSFELCVDNNKKVFGDNGLDYNFCRPYADLAVNYFNLKRYDEAIVLYQNAIKTMCSGAYVNILDDFYYVDSDSIPSFYLADMDALLVELMLVYRAKYEQDKDKDHLKTIVKMSRYGNELIKEWYRNVADEETLLEAVALFKENGKHAMYAYEQLAAVDSHYADSAFVLADLPRAFSLSNLKSLKNTGNTGTLDSLRSKINNLSVDLINSNDKASEEYLMLQLELLKNKMIVNENMPEIEAVFSPDIDPANLKNQIEEDQVLIQYTVDDSIVYMTTCSSDGYVLKSLEFKGLEKHKKELVRALKSGHTNAPIQKWWYDQLIRPIRNEIEGKRHLLIYPDEIFAGLPFEAFQSPDSKYLIQDFSIDYHFSAKQQACESASNATSMMLLAPGFMNSNGLLSHSVSKEAKRSADIFVRQGDRTSLMPLQYSLDEVDELYKLCINTKTEVKKIAKEEATKACFERNASGYSIIHVATHGISKSPAETGLYFSDGERAGDEFLHLSELYRMNFKADLVVLSACKSAIGDVKTGEGVMALPRGFMYAGVPNVVASLWKIHDKKTKELMVSFYQALLDGATYAEALRQAKLKAIKKKWLPLDWAGFVLLCE